MELENSLEEAKPKIKKAEVKEVTPELKMEKRVVKENNSEDVALDAEVSPLNSTFAELKKRADERRMKMDKYNYKFARNVKQTIDELEKQPAYKRNNVELDENLTSNNITRTSLETDGDDITFRSNNSFLHDNVD